jgi:hypothetical protein
MKSELFQSAESPVILRTETDSKYKQKPQNILPKSMS